MGPTGSSGLLPAVSLSQHTPRKGPPQLMTVSGGISEGSRRQHLLSFRRKPLRGPCHHFYPRTLFIQPQVLWVPETCAEP